MLFLFSFHFSLCAPLAINYFSLFLLLLLFFLIYVPLAELVQFLVLHALFALRVVEKTMRLMLEVTAARERVKDKSRYLPPYKL
jgi:hypothetical protein